ncbi:MAG: DEAD/DEAH box helicase family protein [Kiritimatiellia bacterium]|nr:DEAD/DEAH box helicase family protein [Kiritimatiellia bacterium]
MASNTIIENPVINSPFAEPLRHFRFDDEGITNEIVPARRISAYFIPIAQPRKRTKDQLVFNTEWTKDRMEENKTINRIRERVALWRRGGYPGVTRTTARLLEYWTIPQRERKLFFCQIEALETIIYLTEAARKYGDTWIENELKSANETANPGLFRIAIKMATGSGKTVVMGMLIAWHTLNKLANPQDNRFTDTFLIVTPGITIRDRLRVLLPNDPGNYYRQRDLLPMHMMNELGQAKIIIANFHGFKLREKIAAGKLTKSILSKNADGVFTESPAEMVRRVCRELGNKKQIIVISDEAHHCYRHKPDGEEGELKGDERKEAETREEYARVWISGLEAVREQIGIKAIYDLSATPFFLRGSGYSEGTLFPWVVSDFSLIDAIESGIVKVPRVPVSDDSMKGNQPIYRDIWTRIRDGLPKKGRGTDAVIGEPKLPKELQGALHSLYDNYRKYYELWEKNPEAGANNMTPPVFIVVCNNCNVSKIVYDYIAGWEKPLPDGKAALVPGSLPIFSNVVDGQWTMRPNTILIDSEQLESGEAMSAEFKTAAIREIEEFKDECRLRFPGRDVEKIADEDILREVMNTVGKPGKLGEHVKCVISVSMLTEGWDANTVTHILGIRAFGTQLLCEQVVGRGLRRRDYATEKRILDVNGQPVEIEVFPTEYAEVYGVPFSFIPCAGNSNGPTPLKPMTHVRALSERAGREITFPRLTGYRYELPAEKLTAKFTEDSRMTLSTEEVPWKTINAPIVGESSVHTLEDLKNRRLQQVAFLLAKLTLEKYFRTGEEQLPKEETEHRFISDVKAWLFPQLLEITNEWLKNCVICKDNTFPQLLLFLEYAHNASDRIYRSIVQGTEGEKTLLPILQPYDTIGSTRYVDFDTTRPVWSARADKCHVSHVVADTNSWEQKLAQTLEDMGEVICYVKNDHVGFTIPYTINGEEHAYIPDFIARIKPDAASPDALNLILEVTGEKKPEKAAKVSTARTLWIPAVNNHGGFGRWAFIEITDPWNAVADIRRSLKS